MAQHRPPPTPATLIEALAALERRPQMGLTVLERRGRHPVHRPYPELVARARGWAAWLEARGVRPGQVVYLCLPTSHDLVEGFLGATILGALPCCLALPRAIGGLDTFARRIELLQARFGGALITSPDVGPECGVPYETPPETLPEGLPLRPVDPATLAYVQLTSGSTTTPKAVSITHGNLSANTGGIIRSGEGHADEIYVSWLPLYHDMGLVGIALTAMFHGVGLVLMTPETFVGTPLRWLEAIAEAPASVVTSAPNFGYQWCVDRIQAGKEAGLDLSNWRLAVCGAEMVRPKTLEEFSARFGPCGFRAGTFAPSYGMAETTLCVTMSPPGRAPRIRDGRVSCGPPIAGLSVEVWSPDGSSQLPEGREGELVVQGSSVFPGYHGDPAATSAVLREGRFHTGDLGFLSDGELYVTGRLKELLILDGVNVAPYELEWVAQELLPLEGGRAAAFSVEREGRERPVLVVEVKEVPAREVLDELRARIARDFAPLHDLVLVRRGSLPKTSSGKVQRTKILSDYEQGALEGVLWQHLARTEEAT